MKTKKTQMPRILAIVGPTATGKSDLAVELARRLGGEVVSADSRQVYKGLDIGSGKITKREMKGVPHHLLDVASPKGRRYTVEDFKRDAAKAIEDILSRGKLPIVCGGTGFYIDALVFGESFPDVPPNPALRKRLAKRSVESLMKELAELDPRRAKEIDPRNKVRVIRAIEIARALGKVPKTRRARAYDAVWIGLRLDRAALREKIRARLVKRMKAGMAREAARLHKEGVSWKRMDEFGLEYRHLAALLQKKVGRPEMLAALESDIFAYAKRQEAWFKRNEEIAWIDPSDEARALKLARAFLT